MKSGTLMILGPDQESIGRKVFDLKIIQTFPIITTDPGKTKLIADGTETEIDDYQHFSIPPDLGLHLTKSSGNDRHLRFDLNLVNPEEGTLTEDFVRLFTWRSRPISNYRQPIGKWHQAQIICLPKDTQFTEKTGIFIDFFVHKNREDAQRIQQLPYLDSSMRYVGDNSGNITGPYEFNEIVRGNHKVNPNYLFTIRFGYHEAEDDCAILDVPFLLR